MAENLPYLLSPASLTKALERIKSAAAPDRVTTDFVTTVLGIKGGTGSAILPFLKRAGFVRTDGVPSELYHQFRNSTSSKYAGATAFKTAYKTLFDRNEYSNKLNENDLKGMIVEITGQPSDSRVTQAILGTIRVFKGFCDFEKQDSAEAKVPPKKHDDDEKGDAEATSLAKTKELGIRIGYTINLNLPATDDVKVFDAIFRSLKDNLLKD